LPGNEINKFHTDKMLIIIMEEDKRKRSC